MKTVAVTGDFDDLRSSHIRFIEEAARYGHLQVYLWSDELIESTFGRSPKFPVDERIYLLEAIRYVDKVIVVDQLPAPDSLAPTAGTPANAWIVPQWEDTAATRSQCESVGIEYIVITERDMQGFPAVPSGESHKASGARRVIVTGCYDWFHSGHVRFFEEVSGYGDLYVVVGHDANVRALKGEGHPMFPQEERRYVVQSVRYVKQALISTGHGWMDAAPEIATIKPDIYAVNEDGDKPEKREFCQAHGIEYLVLKRAPKAGLPRRESTRLRGF